MKNKIEDLLLDVERIKEEGNVLMIKFDGERDIEKITVVIASPDPKKQEVIRHNGDKLEVVLNNAIIEYTKTW